MENLSLDLRKFKILKNEKDENLIDCTGDAVTGDYVKFEKAIFSGTYPNATYEGMETIIGKIIKDSYGKKKGQHTFTILRDNGENMRIKGRNLYKNGCKRLLWDNEADRIKIADEKHERGNKVRKAKSREKSWYIGGNAGFYYPVCKICGQSFQEFAVSEKNICPPPDCNCLL
ncbi:MAG: hypothetical protein L3J56_00975 [Bacteroidales bacterium]|nr:hypothetical protein [Bacteroidales bacterium]